MDRRNFSKLLALLAISPNQGLGNISKEDKIVIIGAGIVGSAIAYHLTKMGAAVTVIERDRPAAHASGRSFSWLHASYPTKPYSFHHLLGLGLLAYHKLENEIGIDIRWGGSFEWHASKESQKLLAKEIEVQQRYGVPIHMISGAQAHELEPNVKFDKDASIAYSNSDGAVDAIEVVNKFLKTTSDLGGQVLYPAAYKNVKIKGGKIVAVKTSIGEIEADRVVYACGVDTDEVLKIDVLKASTPEIILRTQPMEKIIDRVLVLPNFHIHQQNDGTVVIGATNTTEDGAPVGALPGAPESHVDRLASMPESFPDDVLKKQHAERILAYAQQFIPELKTVELDHVTIGWIPTTQSGSPVVGHLKNIPGAYLATMPSGITFAPIIGELVAMELLDGKETDLLADYRPDRFI
jgi:glycine/D-amino acid oxidase-like deaminating enzyme